MNDVIKKNVRALREQRGWSQEHLAGAAGVSARTIQRVETTGAINSESLMAIANAFDVSLDVLRADIVGVEARLRDLQMFGITEEDLGDTDAIKQKFEAFKASHVLLPLTSVEHAADLRVLGSSHALHFECTCPDDASQQEAAELQQMLRDGSNIWSDLGATEQWQYLVDCYQHVARLRTLGATVVCAAHEHGLRFETVAGAALLDVLYVLVVPQRDRPLRLAISKSRGVRLCVTSFARCPLSAGADRSGAVRSSLEVRAAPHPRRVRPLAVVPCAA